MLKVETYNHDYVHNTIAMFKFCFHLGVAGLLTLMSAASLSPGGVCTCLSVSVWVQGTAELCCYLLGSTCGVLYNQLNPKSLCRGNTNVCL